MKKNIENSDMPISSPTMLAPRSGPQPEDRERHQRIALAQLDRHERDQQHHGRGQADDRPGRAPADVDRVDDGVHEQRQPGGDGHRAGDVERVAGRLRARLSPSMRGASAAAISPIGTLTNSTQRQLSPLVRIPPSSTPAAPPAPGDRAPDAERAVALGARRRTWW